MPDRARQWAEARVTELVSCLLRDAPVLEIAAGGGPGGALVVDCGVLVRGSWEAGRRLTLVSHGGMMSASLGVCELGGMTLAELVCDSWRPPLSTVALQVSFALGEVDPGVRISGPIRASIDGAVPTRGAVRRRVTRARNPWGVAIVESDRLPTAGVVQAIARRAGLSSRELTLLVVPSSSLAGVAQIAGRLNECVLFTLKESLGLDPGCVVGILGAVPLAPAGPETFALQDDMIHYAGRVEMVVDAPEAWDIRAVADALVFRSSPAYGRRFADLLAEAGGVFEAVPGLNDLQKVAAVTLVDRRSGRTAAAGAVDVAMLLPERLRRGGRDEAQ